jgi:hypothetical protein
MMRPPLLLLAGLFAARTALGAIYITEIMYDPNDGASMPDATHEFVEIYNSIGSAPVNVQNWTVTVDAGAPSLITASSFVLAPGSFLVLGNTSLATFNSSYNVSLTGANYIQVAGGLPSLSNAGSTIDIDNASAVNQATVSYTNAGPWPAGMEGRSIGLKYYAEYVPPTAYQSGSNWENHMTAAAGGLMVSTVNSGGYASPGYQIPIPEPTSLGLLAFGALILRRIRSAK